MGIWRIEIEEDADGLEECIMSSELGPKWSM
jgi:hypothetical protein